MVARPPVLLSEIRSHRPISTTRVRVWIFPVLELFKLSSEITDFDDKLFEEQLHAQLGVLSVKDAVQIIQDQIICQNATAGMSIKIFRI